MLHDGCRTCATGPRYQALGKGARDLTRSASPTPIRPGRAEVAGLAGCRLSRDHGLHGAPRHDEGPPHELLPGTLRVISVRMNYLPFEAGFAATLRDPTSATSAAMPSAATITRCCATGSSSWGAHRAAVRNPVAGGGTNPGRVAPLRRLGPYSGKRRWRPRPAFGWVGKHSLLLSNESAGSFFFWGIAHRPAAAARGCPGGEGAVWQVRGLHQHLPHRCHHRPLCGGRTALHLLSHH